MTKKILFYKPEDLKPRHIYSLKKSKELKCWTLLWRDTTGTDSNEDYLIMTYRIREEAIPSARAYCRQAFIINGIPSKLNIYIKSGKHSQAKNNDNRYNVKTIRGYLKERIS